MRSQKFAVHSEDMSDKPQHEWRERELLARKLQESGMSARRAAEKMRITDTRLRHIINGYQPVGRGQRIEVVAPADTLADIGLALSIKPEEMAEAGRTDAAEIMEKILGLRPMDSMIPGDQQWNRILAQHDEIRAWADEGIEITLPPDAILQMFDDEQLLAEVGRRMRYGSPFVHVVDDLPRGGDGDADAATGSAAPTRDDYELIAHDEAHTIAEEQEAPDTP